MVEALEQAWADIRRRPNDLPPARVGWSPTTLTETTRQGYADTIAILGDALRLFRSAEISGGRTSKLTNPPACVCDCGRLRVAPSVLAAGPIACGICGSDFHPDQ